MDFRNTVIILTSNMGGQLNVDAGASDAAQWAVVEKAVRDQLQNFFRPEFLNRVDEVVVFHQLSRNDIMQIVTIQLAALERTLAARHIGLRVHPEARELIEQEGYNHV